MAAPLDAAGAVVHVKTSDTVGTYQFLAPECCAGDPFDPFTADVWAIGMILYIFVFGCLPFESSTTKELFDEILNAEIVLPIDKHPVSSECQDLLLCLLTRNPDDRISIADALKHSWLSEDSEEPPSF